MCEDKVDDFWIHSLTLYRDEAEDNANEPEDVAPPSRPTSDSGAVPLKSILRAPSAFFRTIPVVTRSAAAPTPNPMASFREPFLSSWSSLLKYDNDAVLGAAPPAKRLRTRQDDGYRPHGRIDVPQVVQRRSSRHHVPTSKFSEYQSSMDITLAMEDFPSSTLPSASEIDLLDDVEPRRGVTFNSQLKVFEIPSQKTLDHWYLADETPSYDVPLPPDPVYKKSKKPTKRRQRLPPAPEPSAPPSISLRGRHRTPTKKLNIACVDDFTY
uniref:Uncharacterized protein n=1 Tax=Panagrellus redivivus TaxID=6233 RepID=A0A7E4ZRZ5_PANRE